MANNAHDWQSLVELSGLLVSEPVLREQFPDGPQPIDAWRSRRFRTEYERWQGAENRRKTDTEAADRARKRWIEFVLKTVLDYGEDALRGGMVLPPELTIDLTDYMQTLKPNMALVNAQAEPVVLVYVAVGDLDRPEQITGRWKASPFTKLDRLLRETRVQLGILTNGQDWRLIYAAPGLPTSYITWTANGWNDERSTLQAFAMLLRNPAKLLEMASESQQRQADVTDQLGSQVLNALAIFVRQLDAADKASGGELLEGYTPEQVYEMALFLMMRLVFIFYAEENNLLPHGDVFYDQAYGLTYLWNRLDRERLTEEDHFAQRADAWPGLLATFRLIHDGCSHPDFALVAYGGALFEPQRFPVLEEPGLQISNIALWHILRHLTTAENRDGRQRVSYRALQVEQLGYVYENLLGYTVKAAREPLIQPVGGVEAFPVANFVDALEAEGLYDYFKTVTKLHWSQARSIVEEVERRAQENGDLHWVLEPLVEAVIDPGDRYVAFQMGTRKRGGIFYTPPQLTSFLVEQALRPQCYDDPDSDTPRIRAARHILSLKVCDPAMGSGAFLVQAVRYLADRLLEAWDAAVADADGTTLVMPFAQPEAEAAKNYGPIPTDRAEALAWARRLVAERCIWGVDLNHLAVELAKLSLWLVTLSKNKPFTFLDHRLRHGNSLIGASFFAETTLEVKKRRAREFEAVGVEASVRQITFIPDAALTAHKGASKAEQAAARDRIKNNRIAQQAIVGGQIGLFADMGVEEALTTLVQRRDELEQPTRRAGDYDSKATLLRQVVEQGDYPLLKEIADLWCAVWFWPRDGSQHGPPPTTQEYHDTIYTILDLPAIITTGQTRLAQIRRTAQEVAGRETFFHWELEFPEIFTRSNPGFDAMVGNPPWESVKPNSQEFFECHDPNFRNYDKPTAIQVMQDLMSSDWELAAEWESYCLSQEQMVAFAGSSTVYCYQGHSGSNINTYKLFTERFFLLLRIDGTCSIVLPSGIYTDLGCMELRRIMFEAGRIHYLFCFSNERFVFPGVDHRFKFTMLGYSRGHNADSFPSAFRINPREAVRTEDIPLFITDQRNLVRMPIDTIKRLSPDSLSIMEFKSQTDIDVASQMYGDWPLLGAQTDDSWNARFTRGFDLSKDNRLFNTSGAGYPLYEGKMVQQYDAFFSPPNYWIDVEIGNQKYDPVHGIQEHERYRLGFRGVSGSTNERTLITSFVPKKAYNEVLLPLVDFRISDITLQEQLFLSGLLNSLAIDWLLRLKISTRVSHFFLYQLPIPRLQAGNPYFDTLVPRAAKLTCTTHHFADLWEEVMSQPWPDDPSICPPPRSDDSQIESLRQRLRDEIDALVAHLYDLSREDFAHILSTFPLVFPPVVKIGESKLGTVEEGGHVLGSDEAGDMNPKMYNLLKIYDEFAEITAGWSRE